MFHPAFYDIFEGLPRCGPGDNFSTARAFKMLKNLPQKPAILDIGCGPGVQTLELARLSRGNITALDSHQPFMDNLTKKALEMGVINRIKTVNGSMMEIKFPDNSFDLIWAEGSIFIIGFEKGLREWKKFIKPGGYLAVTESNWINKNPPEEIARFWEAVYPAIMDIEGNLRIIREAGYREVGHFILPASSWWDDYYTPMVERMKVLRPKYAGDKDALAVFQEMDVEIEMFRKYSDYYSYVFYIMQKPG
jgi:ubiquinone/menaquinone biosynthesis C-methylase UbiE